MNEMPKNEKEMSKMHKQMDSPEEIKKMMSGMCDMKEMGGMEKIDKMKKEM